MKPISAESHLYEYSSLTPEGGESPEPIYQESVERRLRLLPEPVRGAQDNSEGKLLAAAFDNIGTIIDKALRSFMTGLQEKNREQFARLSSNYDGALTTLRKVGSVCSSIEQVLKRLGGYENTLKTFVLQVGGDRLASLTGVSGIVVRENFGAINAMAADLKREKEYLEAARKEIADKTSRVLKGDAGAAEETP